MLQSFHICAWALCVCVLMLETFFPSARDLLLNFSLKTHHRGYYTRFGGLQMRMWFWLLWLNIFSLRHTNTRTAHNHFGTQISENGGNIHSTPFCPTAHKIQLTKNWFEFSKHLCFNCLRALNFCSLLSIILRWMYTIILLPWNLEMWVVSLWFVDFYTILFSLNVYCHSCQNSRQWSSPFAGTKTKTKLSSMFIFHYTFLILIFNLSAAFWEPLCI